MPEPQIVRLDVGRSAVGMSDGRTVDLDGADGLNARISLIRIEKNLDEPDVFVFREHCPMDRASFKHGRRVMVHDLRYTQVLRNRGGAGDDIQAIFGGRISEVSRKADGKGEQVEYLCRSLFEDLNGFQVTNNGRQQLPPNPDALPRLVYNADPDDEDFVDNALTDPRSDLIAIGEDMEYRHASLLYPIIGPFTVTPGSHDLFPASLRISLGWYAGEKPVPPKTVFDGATFLEAYLSLIKQTHPGIRFWQHYFDTLDPDIMTVQVDPFDPLTMFGLQSGFYRKMRWDLDAGTTLSNTVASDIRRRFTAVRLVGRRKKTEPAVAKLVSDINSLPLPFADRYAIVPMWGSDEVDRRRLESIWSCTTLPLMTWIGPTINGGGPSQPFVQVAGNPWQPGWWDGGHIKVEFDVLRTNPPPPPNPDTWEADVTTSFRDILNLAAGTQPPPGPLGWGRLQLRGLHRITVTARPAAAGGGLADVYRTYLIVDTQETEPGARWRFKAVGLQHAKDTCCPTYLVQALLGPSQNPTASMLPVDADIVRETRMIGGQSVTLDLLVLAAPAYRGSSCATPGSAIMNPVQEFRFCVDSGGALSIRYPKSPDTWVGQPGQDPSSAYSELGIKQEFLVMEDTINEENLKTDSNGNYLYPEFVTGARAHARSLLLSLKDIIYNGEITIIGIDYRWAVFLDKDMRWEHNVRMAPIPAEEVSPEPCVQALVDLYLGGQRIVEGAQHLRHVYDLQNDTTTISLTTDRSGGTNRFDRVVADLRARQKAKDLERIVSRIQAVGKCEAGQRGNMGGVGGGGQPGGPGGYGPSGGSLIWRGRGGGGVTMAQLGDALVAMAQLVGVAIAELKQEIKDTLGDKLEIAQKLILLNKLLGPVDSTEEKFYSLFEESPPSPTSTMPDVSSILSAIPDASRRMLGVTTMPNGEVVLLIGVKHHDDPFVEEPVNSELFFDLKQVLRLKGILDPETRSVSVHPTQRIPVLADAMGGLDAVLNRLAVEMTGWVILEGAQLEDPRAGAGNHEFPPGWLTTDTWLTWCAREGVNPVTYPTPESYSPAGGYSINEGSVMTQPLGIGMGNIGIPFILPQAPNLPERQRFAIVNSRGFFPARLASRGPQWHAGDVFPPNFLIVELDPNRTARDAATTFGVDSVLARIRRQEIGHAFMFLPGGTPAFASSTTTTGTAVTESDAALYRTSRENYTLRSGLDGNRVGTAVALDVNDQWIIDATGRVPVGGWPSGVSAGWLQKMWGLIFQPTAELDTRTAGAGATANPGGTDNAGLGNFGAVFLDAAAAYVVVNEDGVFPALLAANGKVQLSGAAFSTITFGGLLGYGLPGGVGAFVILGGQLGGSKTAPDVRGLRETGGPTLLTMGGVADGQVLKRSGSTVVGFTDAGGTVTSVGLSLPEEFGVSGSPVTGAGTLTVTWAVAGESKAFMGPASGGGDGTPLFRAILAGDLPATLNSTTISTVLTVTTVKPPVDWIGFQASSGTDVFLQGVSGHNLNIKCGRTDLNRTVRIYDNGTNGEVAGLPSLLLSSLTNDVIVKPKNDVVTMTPGSSAVAGTSVYMQAASTFNFQLKAGTNSAGRLVHLYDDATDGRVHGWPGLNLSTQSGDIKLTPYGNVTITAGKTIDGVDVGSNFASYSMGSASGACRSACNVVQIGAGGSVVVTVPFSYASQYTYVAVATGAATSAFAVSTSITAANSFTIYGTALAWVYWLTFGTV